MQLAATQLGVYSGIFAPIPPRWKLRSQEVKKATLLTQPALAEPEEEPSPGWLQPHLQLQTVAGPTLCELDSGCLWLLLIQHDREESCTDAFPEHGRWRPHWAVAGPVR